MHPTPAHLTAADVTTAAAELAALGDVVRRTPVWEVRLAGRPLLLKAEHMQRSGSFKLRGAALAVSRARTAGAPGVVAASGGNHGLAIATAAGLLEVRAHVFVPASAPADKVDRIRATGADVTLVEGDYQDAAVAAATLADAHDLPFLPAFDHPDVIAGQGTCAAEVLDERPDVTALLVSVGGGGLLCGTALAAAGRVPVVGAEPTGIPTVTRALEAGRPVEVEVDSVTASGLGARTTSEVNLAVLHDHPVTMRLVDDAAILAARDLLWSEHRVAVEPAAGAALAVALAADPDLLGDLPCVVLCGANSGWSAHP